MADTVWSLITAQAEDHTTKPALVGLDRSWTYEQLLEAVEGIAGSLWELGLRPGGGRVAVVGENHWSTVLLYLAGLRSGITVSVVNSRLTESELQFVLKKLDTRLLISDTTRAEVARDASRDLNLATPPISVIPNTASGGPAWDDFASGSRWLGGDALPEHESEICFTSGTTSRPKGAVFRNRETVFLMEAWTPASNLRADDRAYAIVPLFHASGLRYSVLHMLCIGGSAVVRPFTAKRFWNEVRDFACTYFFAPEGIPLILETLEPSSAETSHGLRYMYGGGPPEFADRFEHRFAVKVVNAYGMSEFGPACTSELPRLDENKSRRRRHRLPGAMYIGMPIHPQIKLEVADERGSPQPDGVEGEICVSSPGMFCRYLDEPHATEAAFRGSWTRTGDLGVRFEDGSHYFTGRIKDVIRRSGENVSAAEVEDAVLSHPAVAAVAVFPVPDPLRVQEIKAVVVPMSPSLQASDLWVWCCERLAEFKVPRYLEFRSHLPRNAIGKALKEVLRGEPIAGEGQTFDRSTGALVIPPDDGLM